MKSLPPSQVLAIVLPNSIEYSITFLAAVGMRAVVSTFNPAYTKDEIRHQLLDCNARILVTNASLLPTCLDAALNTTVDTVVCTTLPEPFENVLSFASLLAAGAEGEESVFEVPMGFESARELAIIPYSSGTSGLPKGVMLSHANLMIQVQF